MRHATRVVRPSQASVDFLQNSSTIVYRGASRILLPGREVIDRRLQPRFPFAYLVFFDVFPIAPRCFLVSAADPLLRE